MCKLKKNSPIKGGCWIFRIHGEDLTRERGNSGGLRPLASRRSYENMKLGLRINRETCRLERAKNHINAAN